MTKARLRHLAEVGSLAAIYFATARIGLGLEAVEGFATLVWPPTGIALVAVLIFGRRIWPGVAIGAFLATMGGHPPIPVALGIAAGNTLEALLGAWALRRIPGFRNSLDELRSVFGLILLAAVLSTTVSATVGVASLHLGGLVPLERCAETWRVWWLGDLAGDLVFAPVLLSWLGWRARPRASEGPRRILEVAALAIAVAAVSLVVYLWPAMGGVHFAGSPYPFFPLLIWAALRFDQRGASTTMLIVCVIAIIGTAMGHGPFVKSSLHASLLALQTFMAIAAGTSLILGAASSERRRAVEALRAAQRDLESRVEQRTAEVTKANAELRRREAQLSESQELAHIGAWEWDIRTNVVTWTDELYRIYGLRREDLAASYEGFLARIHPDDRAAVDETIRRSLPAAKAFESQERVVRPNGEIRVLQSWGRVVVDESGHSIRMAGSCQDITQRKQAEDALQRAHDELEIRVQERTAELVQLNATLRKSEAELEAAVRARDAFISIASHELRSPLSALSLHVQMLTRSAGMEPAGGIPTMDALSRQVKRLIGLVEGLLDVSRITAGKLPLELEDVDLTAVVRDVVARFDEELRRARCPLTVRVDACVIGHWDRMRIDQIVTNLLSNAIKYGRGKAIEIMVASDGQRGRLVVRDHGMGIDPDDQTRIFERFERLVTGSQVSGFGLGLWIVRQIVDALAGTIRLVSSPGAGATFTVELPLSRLAASREPSSPRVAATEPFPTTLSVEAASSNRPAGQVLVVEDDQDILEAVRQVLRGEGYDVAAATNGQEAIEYLRSTRPPRVILLDLMMPVMDGGQFLRVLEQDRALATIPVVVLSADGQLRQKAEELNVAGYLQKPVSVEGLLSLIQRHCPRA